MPLPTLFKSKRFYAYLLAGFVGFITLFMVFAWLGLPHLIQWQAEKQVFEKSGHTLKMGLPEINPFKLTVLIPNLSLSTPEKKQIASFSKLFVDVAAADLFKGAITIEALDITGLHLDMALLQNGTLNWSPLINAFASKQPNNDPPPAFKLQRLSIHNSQVNLHDLRTPDGFETQLAPLNIELTHLSTVANQAGDFLLNAKTGFGGELKLKAQVALPQADVQGQISIEKIDLAKLQELLSPFLPTAPPTGLVNVATHFHANLHGNKPQFSLTKLEVAASELNLRANTSDNAPAFSLAQFELHNGQFDSHTQTLGLGSVQLQKLALKPIAIDQIELNTLNVDLSKHKAKLGLIAIQGGEAQIQRDKNGEVNLLQAMQAWAPIVQRKPTATKPDAATTAMPWSFEIDKASAHGIHTHIQDNSLAQGLELGLNNLSIDAQHITQDLSKSLPIQASVDLQSGGHINAAGQVTPQTGNSQLQVEATNLALKPAQAFISQFIKLDLASGKASSKGDLAYNTQGIAYKGSFALDDLRLNVAGTNTPFLQWKSLTTTSVNATQKSMTINRLDLNGLDTKLLIAKDKTTNITKLLVNHPTEKASTTANKASSAKSPSFLVNINRFGINNSELDFADQSLILPFGTRVHDLSGTVTGLSTQKGSQGDIDLKGEVDNYGVAKAKGKLDLFDPTAFMDIAVQFKNVEMTTLTPYSATFVNRKINSGKLSLNLEYKIENSKLTSTNQLIIDKLTLGERVESPQARDLPLDLAIALLQDSNGRIDLGMPIDGSLDDPQFSFGGLVWKVLSNVITKVVTAPFRALGSLFGGGHEDDLGHIAFEAGQHELSPPERENLDLLAKALAKRPNLGLRIHGTWSNADKVALQTQQLRHTIATMSGEKPQADEVLESLSLQSPRTQTALEDLYIKRIGRKELNALKTRDKSLYATLKTELEKTEQVTPAQLENLAQQRQKNILEGLISQGVEAARVEASEVESIQEDQNNTEVPIKLELKPKKAPN